MIKVFKADHDRRIELAGVGPAPRPVDIDQAQTGFGALRTLRIYHFEPPAVIHGHAEEDEVFIVILEGEVELQVRSEHWSRSETRFTLKAAETAALNACAAYLPPHAEYSLAPRTIADVAYARAQPTTARAPAVFSTSPVDERVAPGLLLDEPSYAQRLRLQLWCAETHGTTAELPYAHGSATSAETLIHVRSTPARALAVSGPGFAEVTLDSWDTVGLSAGERPQLRLAAAASAISLVVSAA